MALDKALPLRSGGDASDWCFPAMAPWQAGDKARARACYARAVVVDQGEEIAG